VGIVERAQARGVVLRLLGAVAAYAHSLHEPVAIGIYRSIGRFLPEGRLFTDVDLAAYSKQRKEIVELFEKELGFTYDLMAKAIFGYKRLIYYHPKGLYHVDVFFDKLEFCHDVVFGDRPERGVLGGDYPTAPLKELILEKLQITKITGKDLVDLAVLFRAHDVCRGAARECVDADGIALILSDDWGFWYDATSNLRKLAWFVNKIHAEGKLGAEDRELILGRVDRLLGVIEAREKTGKWLKRAKVGTAKPWYREVEELVR